MTTDIGCHIGGICANQIWYADDMVLLAFSAKALQGVLNVCSEYAEGCDIVFNLVKTVCHAFRP